VGVNFDLVLTVNDLWRPFSIGDDPPTTLILVTRDL